MRIGDRRRIFINSSCQVEATVKMVRPYGQGRERRPVIFTSNCDTSHLDCDERIADRIEAMTVPLRMPEVRVRKQIAARESGEFLRSVMG